MYNLMNKNLQPLKTKDGSTYETQFNQWLIDVAYPDYHFAVRTNGRGDLYLQAWYNEADIYTGVVCPQYTRRWYLSIRMVKSEFIQTVLKCILTSAEHRVREHFKYQGMRVYSPHHDVDALWQICKDQKNDYRTE